jgi:hypothetical protein
VCPQELFGKMSVSRGEFWVGTIVTLLGIATGVYQTRIQIDATTKENHVGRYVAALRDITSAINKVDEQLETHASMYIEMERCLTPPRVAPDNCWARKYTFDGQASARAWSELETAVEASYPIVAGSAARILDQLREVRKSHQFRTRPLLAPRTSDKARELFDQIETTRGHLSRQYGRTGLPYRIVVGCSGQEQSHRR